MSNVVDRPPVYDSKESYGMKGWFQTIYNIFKGITKIDSNLLFDLGKGITTPTGATIYSGPAGNTWFIKPGSGVGATILTLLKADGTTATLNFSQSSTQVESLLDLSTNNGDNTNGQIKFPATQNASADANTLDDYEEGTWTPGITFGGAAVGLTYAASGQVGLYTKIGRLVMAQGYVYLSNKGTSVGAANVTGLPFTSNSTSNSYGSISVRYNNVTGISGGPQGYISPGSTSVIISYSGTGTDTVMTDTNFANNTDIEVTAIYTV